LLEVTLNTEKALEAIGRWRERFAGQVYIGAGPFTTSKWAAVAGCRAQFLYFANLDEEW
jgi:2-dehydro-3-deoxyphosphogluconate aldolase/(4S)-4-hydroxy-2-oxoglutarate aldolase